MPYKNPEDERAYRERTKEHRAEYLRVWRAANREHLQKYREEHKADIAKYRARYYAKHREEEIANSVRWQAAHPEQVRGYDRKRAGTAKRVLSKVRSHMSGARDALDALPLVIRIEPEEWTDDDAS